MEKVQVSIPKHIHNSNSLASNLYKYFSKATNLSISSKIDFKILNYFEISHSSGFLEFMNCHNLTAKTWLFLGQFEKENVNTWLIP